MKDGVGPILRGDIDEAPLAGGPNSRLSTKFTKSSLDASGLKLIVLSFYAHPILTLGAVRESLVRQIESAERFVAENPGWVIASEPSEARTALGAGKRVFVLSIETAGGVLETEEDRALFVDRKKVRIVTFMHLSPDRLGRGVALWPGAGVLNSPLENLQAWISKSTDPVSGAYVNPHGLSAFGKTTLEALVKNRVWIDLAHASDRAQREIVEVLDRVGQPSLVTHTKLREISQNERSVPNFTLDRVRATGGIVGLIPTDDMTKELGVASGLSANCRRGIRAFAEEWRRTAELAGSPAAVTLGSDFNAPLRGLRGGCPDVAISEAPTFAENGFYRGDDLPKLFSSFRAAGVETEPDPELAVERFLRAWEKVRGTVKAGKGKAPQSP